MWLVNMVNSTQRTKTQTHVARFGLFIFVSVVCSSFLLQVFRGPVVMDEALYMSPDFLRVVGEVMRALCQVGRFVYAEAWYPSKSTKYGEVHKSLPVFYAAKGYAQKLVIFRKLTESIAFPDNIGIPGRAAHKKHIEWVEDVCTLPPTNFLRLELAQQVGFHSTCAVPIVSPKFVRPLCVLVLWAAEARKEEIRVMKEVQTTVNRFLPRLHQAFDLTSPAISTDAASLSVALPSLQTLDLPPRGGLLAAPVGAVTSLPQLENSPGIESLQLKRGLEDDSGRQTRHRIG